MPERLVKKWKGRKLDYIRHAIKALEMLESHDAREVAKSLETGTDPITIVSEAAMVTKYLDFLSYLRNIKDEKIPCNC